MAGTDTTAGALRGIILIGLLWLTAMAGLSAVGEGYDHAWTWYVWLALTFVVLPLCGLVAARLHRRCQPYAGAPGQDDRRDEAVKGATVVRGQPITGAVELLTLALTVASTVVAISQQDKAFPSVILMPSMLLLVATLVHSADRGEAVESLRRSRRPLR